MEKYIVFMDRKNQYSENEFYYPKQSIDSMQSLSSYQLYFFTELEQIISQFVCMEIQKTSNSQSNLEKEEWNWRNQPA